MGRDASTALVLIIRRRRLFPILRSIILTIYYPFLYNMCYYKRDIFICRVLQTIYIYYKFKYNITTHCCYNGSRTIEFYLFLNPHVYLKMY